MGKGSGEKKGCQCDKYFWWGFGLFMLGSTLILLGLVAEFVFPSFLRHQIINNIVVDSKSAAGYEMWESTSYDGAPPIFNIFYFFNMTNPEEVLNGQKPIYEEVGPIYYRKYRQRIDVEFSDDGNQVTYKTYDRLIYDDALSVMKQDDTITNVNPAYMGVMQNTGGELQLVIAYTGPTFQKILTFLNTTYLDYIISAAVPENLKYEQEKLIAKVGVNQFYATWANSTKQPSDDWMGMIVSLGGQSSQISLSTAETLFNESVAYSLTNMERRSTDTWSAATKGNATAIQLLAGQFKLSNAQVQMLSSWLVNQFDPYVVYPALCAEYNISSVYDICWVQWGQGTVTNNSIAILFPDQWASYGVYPEYSFLAAPPTLSVAVSKNLMTGRYGLFLPANVGMFFNLALASAYSNITALWGLSDDEISSVFSYTATVSSKIGQPDIETAFTEGGGVITTRTVSEWLFNATDPLLAVLEPSTNGNISLVKNYTSEQDARNREKLNTVYTGKSDIDLVDYYVIWQETTVINNWAVNLTITGSNEWGQFRPFLEEDTVLTVLNLEYNRALNMLNVGTTEHKGITTHRYQMSNNTWDVNPVYYNSIKGFANMTSVLRAPVFLCNPHFSGCEDKWRAQVAGVHPPTWQDFPMADVEPYTGKVIWARKSLQTNIYVPSNTLFFNYFNPSFKTGLFYPIFTAGEQSELTDAQATKIKNTIYLVRRFIRIGFPIFIAVGALSLVVSCVLLYFAFRNRRRQGYEKINH